MHSFCKAIAKVPHYTGWSWIKNNSDIQAAESKTIATKMFNDANDRDVNTNIIRKTKYSLQKYGLWDGKANLDEGELIMIKEGKKIDEMGIRAYCRELGEKLGMSDNGLRSKLSKLNKYGLIER